MKNYVKPAAFAVALALLAFTQPSKASGGPHSWYGSVIEKTGNGNKFTIELSRPGNGDVLYASIENPGRKNLSVTLTGPDGISMDNFFTGRKFVKMNKQYNFSGADEGLYTIIITDGVEKIKKRIKFERVVTVAENKLTIQ